ncbi:MAG: polysaccharide biosynthesis/export family protein [Pseudomonadales bacterium]|nr:polysaccharide biosynthesis/export family protein [Pseudomonadales bacterium]
MLACYLIYCQTNTLVKLRRVKLIAAYLIGLCGCSACSILPHVPQLADQQTVAPQTIELEQTNEQYPQLKIKRDLHLLESLHSPITKPYTIAKGDKFNIYVYNEDDLNTENIIVKMDGTISCKLIGDIAVGGLTIPEASKRIETKLRQFVRYPKVSLIPYEMKSSSFTIMGKVTQPGFYYFDGSLNLADAIAKAEGLSVGIFDNNTIELADLEHAFIRRGDVILPIDFSALLRHGDSLMNIPLQNGDYIFIPSAMNQEVYIVGEVERQGYFGYKPNMTLGRLFAHAEGIKDHAGDEVLVIRGNLQHPRVYKLSHRKILRGEMQDFRLEPNDIIYVAKGKLGSWNSILSKIVPTLDAGLKAFRIDTEISKRLR